MNKIWISKILKSSESNKKIQSHGSSLRNNSAATWMEINSVLENNISTINM